ncbi:unnamed protein product, partial [Prorocentrum cordatum]
EYAAGALANIFSDNAPSVTKGFEEAPQMVSALVAITSTQERGRRREEAGCLRARDAGGRGDAPCQKAWEAGAKRPLLELLAAGVEQAALGIMNLSWKCPDKKEELAKDGDGAVEHLLKLLESGDDVAKGYAAGALMNMTAGAPQTAARCGGAVPRLVAMLRGPATQAAEWAAGALANVALGNAGAQESASAAGAAPALAALLAKATPSGRPLVVQALAAVAEGHAAAVRKVLGSSEKAKLKEFKASGEKESSSTASRRWSKSSAATSPCDAARAAPLSGRPRVVLGPWEREEQFDIVIRGERRQRLRKASHLAFQS